MYYYSVGQSSFKQHCLLLIVLLLCVAGSVHSTTTSHHHKGGSDIKSQVSCNCTNTLKYCGNQVVNRNGGLCSNQDPNSLYSCVTIGQPPLAMRQCKNGCHVNPIGIDDVCIPDDTTCTCPDARDHCGSSLMNQKNKNCQSLDPNTLYQCSGNGYYPSERWSCGTRGCQAATNVKLNDTCDRGESNTYGLGKVKHIVIFMQENRAMDHYYGTMKGICGFNDPNPMTLESSNNLNNVFYQPDPESPDVFNGEKSTLPFLIYGKKAGCTLGGSNAWGPNHQGWNQGLMNGWATPNGLTAAGMGYLNRTNLPFYFGLADQFTIADMYFQSVMTSTNPNRLVLWTGSIDPRNETGFGPVTDNTETNPFTWLTYPEVLENAGVSWRVYQDVDNFDDNPLAWFKQYQNLSKENPYYINGMDTWGLDSFVKDALEGNLPMVSWVISPTELSEHPDNGPMAGQWYSQQVINAVTNSSAWDSTILILDYDESGGFWDHVPPPIAPYGTLDEWINTDDGPEPLGPGIRVPSFVISPWSTGGKVYTEPIDHTSVIMLVEQWLMELGWEPEQVTCPLISTYRRNFFGDYTRSFDWSSFNSSVPNLPPIPEPTKDQHGVWNPTEECEGLPGPTTTVPYGNQKFPTVEEGWRKVIGSNPGNGRTYVFETIQGGMAIQQGSTSISLSTISPQMSTPSQYFYQIPSKNSTIPGFFIQSFNGDCLIGAGTLVNCNNTMSSNSNNNNIDTWNLIDQSNGQGYIFQNIPTKKYLSVTTTGKIPSFVLVESDPTTFIVYSITYNK